VGVLGTCVRIVIPLAARPDGAADGAGDDAGSAVTADYASSGR
jgi:hypothetical protein